MGSLLIAVARKPLTLSHPKLTVLTGDLATLPALAPQLVADEVFVPHAGRNGESFSEPNIVLHVKAGLQVEVCDVRIADPPGVASRRAGNVRVVVFEHVRTEVI